MLWEDKTKRHYIQYSFGILQPKALAINMPFKRLRHDGELQRKIFTSKVPFNNLLHASSNL
jgi:hypothetical protein